MSAGLETAPPVVEPAIPFSPREAINRRILDVSEDRIRGFVREPFREIARRAGLDPGLVTKRVRAMLEAGAVRRVRQTLRATNLFPGALIAWKIDEALVAQAFRFIAARDPFSGHVVIGNSETGPAEWRLWTALKVPTGFSVDAHCEYLRKQIGAEKYRVMPALRTFVPADSDICRRGLRVGEMSDQRAAAMEPAIVNLSERDWDVLMVLKGDLDPEEIAGGVWERRARGAGIDPETFFTIAEDLDRRGVIGRFSTFLEHSQPVAGDTRSAGFNGLFQWAVPPGREIEAGCEIGRFAILTHCYWRDGGPELNNVNMMAVAHGESRNQVLAHKVAIDQHLFRSGIGFHYTNVYWGSRVEIKPSEISPAAYRDWARKAGIRMNAGSYGA